MRNKKSKNKRDKKSHKKQRGAAKSKKKLRKKKKFLYKAPRLKDGKMTDPEILTYNPYKHDTMDKAATKIQSLTRGRQSRKTKSDMMSDWYPGFPSKAPTEPLDLEVISRITEGAIQGFDSRKERDRIESKIKQVDDRYRTELDELGEFDELKYDWGKYYDYKSKSLNRNVDPAFLSQGRTHAAKFLPSKEEQDIVRFEKKNYDKLRKIADKKEILATTIRKKRYCFRIQ